MIYISIIISILFFIYFFDYKKNRKYRLEIYIFYLILFVLLTGFRFKLGGDSINYELEYPDFPKFTELSEYDYSQSRYNRGFYFLVAFTKIFGSSFINFQLIQAIIVNSLFFSFFYKNTNNIFFALLLYFIAIYFYFTMEILREGIAVSIFLLAWIPFLNKNYLKYYFICLIAILFHPSAIFTLFIPIIYNSSLKKFFSLNKFFLIGIPLFYCICYITYRNLFDYINLLENQDLDNYTSFYSDRDDGKELNALNPFYILKFIFKYILFNLFAIYILTKSTNSKTIPIEFKNKLEFLVCMYIYIVILTNFISIFNRFNNYLLPFSILLYSLVIFDKIPFKRIYFKLSFSLWMIIFIPYIYSIINIYFQPINNSETLSIQRYYPYKNILFSNIEFI